MNVLIIEDDLLLGDKLEQVLKKRSFINRVKILNSYDAFLNELWIMESYDLAIIDVMLGKGFKNTGIDIVKLIRNKKLEIPLVVISGLGEISWLEKAFDSGANDYLIKPFRLKEFEIRILKWTKNFFYSLPLSNINTNIINYKGLSYNLEQNDFFYKNKKITLTKNSKFILNIFLSRPEKLIKSQLLIDIIWGDIYDIVDRNLRINILRLRQSLKPLGIDSWIHNIRGEGYILKK